MSYTLLAAAKVSPSPSPIETPIPTVEATPVATPVPQNWIMTHKKIDLGILIAVVVVGYVIYLFSKKDNQSPPASESKPEEPTETETPPESPSTP
jgi:multisubunit Na+/H+ antiporter MnhC subunit